MKQEKKERTISTLCAPVLLLLLAAGILTVLLGGAAVYRRQNSHGQESGDRRTAALYLTNQIRRAPQGVTLETFGGCQALVLREQVADTGYITRIYCHDGWLRQLFTPENGEFSPEDGEKVLPLASLALTQAGGLLEMQLTDLQGNRDVVKMSVPQGEEAQP